MHLPGAMPRGVRLCGSAQLTISSPCALRRRRQAAQEFSQRRVYLCNLLDLHAGGGQFPQAQAILGIGVEQTDNHAACMGG